MTLPTAQPCHPGSVASSSAWFRSTKKGFNERLPRLRFLIEFLHAASKLCSPCPANGSTEQSLSYATLCVLDRVFPPHPDPLPQGEGTAGVGLVSSQWMFGKHRHGYDREAADHSPSPRGRGQGWATTESSPLQRATSA